METEERIKYTLKVFSFLMQKTVFPAFVFPGGRLARNKVLSAMEDLNEERIVDYCICQVYAASCFGKDYLKRWNVSHSFGHKAIDRFCKNHSVYYEDKWLSGHGLFRNQLVEQFTGAHPLQKYIFPEYEEKTKRRMQGTKTGFYICRVSTLLWTPFSPACRSCHLSEKCKAVTKEKYPELFRIRTETFSNE